MCKGIAARPDLHTDLCNNAHLVSEHLATFTVDGPSRWSAMGNMNTTDVDLTSYLKNPNQSYLRGKYIDADYQFSICCDLTPQSPPSHGSDDPE